MNEILVALWFSLTSKAYLHIPGYIKKYPQAIFIRSFLSVIAWVIFLVVLQQTDISKSYPLFKGLSLIIPVVMGVVILHEKKHLNQKIVGVIAGIIGILLLAFK